MDTIPLIRVVLLKNYKSRPNVRDTFSHGTRFELLLTKNGLGDIFGPVFTNSSGHPGNDRRIVKILSHLINSQGSVSVFNSFANFPAGTDNACLNNDRKSPDI
jgi:hypothetical protein